MHEADDEPPGLAGADPANVGFGLLGAVEEAARALVEEHARPRHLELLLGAMEEGDAEFPLQFLDLTRERGWAMPSDRAARPKWPSEPPH